MNLSDSKKKLAAAGVVCGIAAACLAYFGNPANMALCIGYSGSGWDALG